MVVVSSIFCIAQKCLACLMCSKGFLVEEINLSNLFKPHYSCNKAKVGIKDQSINNTHLDLLYYIMSLPCSTCINYLDHVPVDRQFLIILDIVNYYIYYCWTTQLLVLTVIKRLRCSFVLILLNCPFTAYWMWCSNQSFFEYDYKNYTRNLYD